MSIRLRFVLVSNDQISTVFPSCIGTTASNLPSALIAGIPFLRGAPRTAPSRCPVRRSKRSQILSFSRSAAIATYGLGASGIRQPLLGSAAGRFASTVGSIGFVQGNLPGSACACHDVTFGSVGGNSGLLVVVDLLALAVDSPMS